MSVQILELDFLYLTLLEILQPLTPLFVHLGTNLHPALASSVLIFHADLCQDVHSASPP